MNDDTWVNWIIGIVVVIIVLLGIWWLFGRGPSEPGIPQGIPEVPGVPTTTMPGGESPIPGATTSSTSTPDGYF